MTTTDVELRWIGADAPSQNEVELLEEMVSWHAVRLADAIAADDATLVPTLTDAYRNARAEYNHAKTLREHFWHDGGRHARLPGWLVRGYAIIDQNTRHVYGIADATTLEDAIDEAWGMDIPFDEGIIAIPATELATV